MGFFDAPTRQDPIAFSQYRAVAWATGVVLMIMTPWAIARMLGFAPSTSMYSAIWTIHGMILYPSYLAFVARIAIRERWQMPTTLAVALSGTVPVWGLVMERKLTNARKLQPPR